MKVMFIIIFALTQLVTSLFIGKTEIKKGEIIIERPALAILYMLFIILLVILLNNY